MAFDRCSDQPPRDGSKINVTLEDGQQFVVRYDPAGGAFGESIWRVNEHTWLTPWSKVKAWSHVNSEEG